MHLENLTNEVIGIAKQAGDFIRQERKNFDANKIEYKGLNDLVSYVDKTAERIIVSDLEKVLPEAGFITEEKTTTKIGQRYNWIIDPLDGTTNFMHGIPLFAVAIALQRGDEIVASVIYNPVSEELFLAEKGSGAWLDERKRLRVANRKHLADCVVATGIVSQGRPSDLLQLRQLVQINPAVSGIRRTGSASTDLAWLAAGRFDAYWEAGLKPWDVAPGWLLLREAGGTMTDYAGGPTSIWNGEVVAGNEAIQGQLLKLIKAVK